MNTATHPHGAVRIRGLSKDYGTGSLAVDDLTLEIEPGEFITLLGPSGSGKTTTLNMVAGFEAPTSGAIEIDGQDIAAVPPHRRGLGMVFQHYALFPHVRVIDNVMFPLRRRGVKKPQARQQAAAALALVGLAGFEDRLPRQLSGGQQQRVSFARAVVFDPPVLLMDEPFGALDKRLRQQLQLEVARIHRELRSTFIFVTHDQEEAMALSDRIALFNEGKVVQVGTPRELYRSPATSFVAEFLGDSNLVDGELVNAETFQSPLGPLRVKKADLPLGSSTLLIRPESLRRMSSNEATAGPAENHVDVTITAVTFQGPHRRLECRTSRETTFVVLEPEDRLEVPAIGSQARLAWSADAGVVIPGGMR